MYYYITECVGSYSLSVLDADVNGVHMVKHYRIRDLDNGAGVYISPRLRCTDISNLIDHYSGWLDVDVQKCCVHDQVLVLASVAVY